jgi:hypothetical protein
MQTRIMAILLMSVLWFSGCALNRYEPIRLQDYPYSMKIFDLSFGWRYIISDSGMTIEGYARNNRYPVIQDLELWVEMLDKNRKVKAKQVFFFIPVSMPIDSLSSFSVTLAAKPQKGDKLRFLYRYKAIEGLDEKFDWVNSFEVPAVSE